MRSAVCCDIRQRVLYWGLWTYVDGTYRLCGNVGKKLSLDAALCSRRTQIVSELHLNIQSVPHKYWEWEERRIVEC
jgi:hypothetical protein